jgi:ferredoxin
MTDAEPRTWRLLVVDDGKCIGCRACSNLWAEISSVLSFSDKGPQRTIKFPRAFEEFETRIAEALAEVCPTGAISVALTDERPEGESFALTFELVRCRRCRTPFATEEEVKYIIDRLPEDLRAQSSAVSWMELCPSCRRSAEREAAARDLIVVRSGARR